MSFLSGVNFAFVLLFGVVLTLSFADIPFRRHKKDYVIIFCVLAFIQGLALLFLGGEAPLFKAYPLLTHLPLFLLLKFYYKKSAYMAGLAVFSAYLFCTPRKWIGTALSFFWNYHEDVSFIAQIVVTLPLLFIIVKYISPYVARLKFENEKVLRLVISVPLLYYVIEYAITVYSDLLYTGGAAVVEFIDAALVTVYFMFSIVFLKTLYEKKEIEVERTVLSIMADRFNKEMEALKKSEQQSRIYRHDLRHHLNYLNACIAERRLEEAVEYIRQTSEDIDSMKVEHYSRNESINLIVSAYAERAKEQKIPMDIHISAENFERFRITDLCSLLANTMENAVNACVQVENPEERYIRIRMYEKSNKLCLDARNSCGPEPEFIGGIPVSHKDSHGIGAKSMVHVIEKYEGVYGFSVKDGVFIFQMSM